MRTEFAYLRDIINASESIIDRVNGLSYETFHSSPLISDSVYYRLLIIGEATRCLSVETQQLMPDIPWQQIRRMRNVLVHDYDGVDARIVWDVIEKSSAAARGSDSTCFAVRGMTVFHATTSR
jgi:uncharacterized protein with HEPN domain